MRKTKGMQLVKVFKNNAEECVLFICNKCALKKYRHRKATPSQTTATASHIQRKPPPPQKDPVQGVFNILVIIADHIVRIY